GASANWSNYNALQTSLRTNGYHGLSFLTTYTWAHALASADPLDTSNHQAEYGNTAADIRHRFTFGPSYMIPGRPGFAQMLEGWQVASTVSVYSGRAFNGTQAASDDLSGTGQTGQRWTLAGNPGDFHDFGGRTPIPCFSSSTGSFKSACTLGLP